MGKSKLAPAPRPVDTARIERQKQQRAARLSDLGMLDCLQNVPTDELESLADLSTFRAFLAHETIIHADDLDASLYMLLQGSVRLTLYDKEEREVLIGVLDRGDYYGGWTLFGNVLRRVAAYAETNCYVLQFLLSDIRDLLPAAPRLQAALRAAYVQRLAEFTLARVPIFSQMEPMERMSLTGLLERKHYPRGSTIVSQGSGGDALHLIEAGQVMVERENQTISTLDEGDFIGEMSLLSNKPHSATAKALSPVDIVSLPAAAFQELLERRPDLREKIEEVVNQRRARDETLMNDQERAQRLRVAVEHGLLRGTHLLVRTPALCPPDCRICEEVCAARHGHTRLHLDGVMIGNQDIVDACRQCRVGAECVEACPEDAFRWNNQGALFITEQCTGCGDCVPACPYNAVNRVPRQMNRAKKGTGRRLRLSFRSLQQLSPPVIPLETQLYTHRADKCDLCHGYDDKACVSQCPTGAMRLVPIEEIFPI